MKEYLVLVAIWIVAFGFGVIALRKLDRIIELLEAMK